MSLLKTRPVRAEEGPAGAEVGPKGPEGPGSAPAGKVEEGSQQQAVQQPWPGPWQEQQPPQLQHMLLTVTVYPKVGFYLKRQTFILL